MHFKNSIFIINDEHNCPFYNAKEEFEVSENALKIPTGKPVCLILAQDIVALTSEQAILERQELGIGEQPEFKCGGCGGAHYGKCQWQGRSGDGRRSPRAD